MIHPAIAPVLVLGFAYAAVATPPVPVARWTFVPSGDAPELIADVSGNGFNAEIAASAPVSRSTDADIPGGAALVFSNNDNGVPGFAVGPGANHEALADADQALPPGEWRHLALVSDGAETTTLFLNGLEIVSVPSAPLPADDPLVFGPVTASAGASFSCALADVRLYDAALPPEQIAGLALEPPEEGSLPGSVGTEVAKTLPSFSPSSDEKPQVEQPPTVNKSTARSTTPAPTRVSAPLLHVWTQTD